MQTTTDSNTSKTPRAPGVSNLAQTMAQTGVRSRYKAALVEGKRPTQNNGDEVAKLLLLVPLADLSAFVRGVLGGNDHSDKNPGHQRMCYGNVVRGSVRKGDARTTEWLRAFGS